MTATPSTNGHRGLRARLSALSMAAADAAMHRIYGRRKRGLFHDLPAEVVEIGAGAGANMRYYPAGTRLQAIEPNLRMHPYLRRQARRHRIDLRIRATVGETIDLADRSASAVVATLVLCSVEDPRRVLREVRRILTPGGRFIFLEHVAAPAGSRLRWWQQRLHRPWHYFTEGCHLQRASHQLVAEAGFHRLEIDCFALNTTLPFRPHIFGTAIR